MIQILIYGLSNASILKVIANRLRRFKAVEVKNKHVNTYEKNAYAFLTCAFMLSPHYTIIA